jgi:hypothetical protein
VAAQVMSMSVAPDSSPQVQRFGEESNPVQKWSLAQSITPVAQRQVDEQVQLREIVQRAFQPGGTQASGDLESRLNASKGGGSALAPEVRAFMEPRFGADFSSVRVHTGSEAVQMNRELGAQAFTHGSDVYFGAGKSPGNNELTAHELTHVVQQTGSDNSNVERLHLAPALGTAKTTAPIASNDIKPQNEMMNELNTEVQLFRRAKVILTWIESKHSSAASVTRFKFTPEELFSDKPTMKKLKPVPKSADDLKTTLDLLVHYGVLLAPTKLEPKYVAVTDAESGKLATEKVTQADTDVTKFTQEFKQRVEKHDPLAPVVATDLIPTDWSSDNKQVKTEKQAEENLAKLKAQFEEFLVILKPIGVKQRPPITRATTDTPSPITNKANKVDTWEIPVATQKKPVRFKDPYEKIEKVKDGTHEATKKERERIEKAIKKAETDLKTKGRYRTFSKDVVTLLGRLRKKNTQWSAGTYVGHSWGEFSVDIFIKAGFDKRASGFWDRATVRTFFDDLNTAAEEEDTATGGIGKFAWKAIYNDDPLAAEINKKYGDKRVIHVPHHGPAPDKLHIHLDIRPIDLKKDAVTGYEVKDGRIHLLNSKP